MAIRIYNREYPEPGKQRRQKYKEDKDYRERAKTSSRRTYRRQQEVELGNCLHSLAFLSEVAQTTQVRTKAGRVFSCEALTVAKTAGVLQVIYQTIWRWIKNDMIPAPVLTSVDSQENKYQVYHVQEVEAFIKIIGEHQKTVRYYRRDHTDTVATVRAAIMAIRQELDIG